MDGDGHFTVQSANPSGDLLGLLNRGSFDKSTEPEGVGDFSKEPSELSKLTELSSDHCTLHQYSMAFQRVKFQLLNRNQDRQ